MSTPFIEDRKEGLCGGGGGGGEWGYRFEIHTKGVLLLPGLGIYNNKNQIRVLLNLIIL